MMEVACDVVVDVRGRDIACMARDGRTQSKNCTGRLQPLRHLASTNDFERTERVSVEGQGRPDSPPPVWSVWSLVNPLHRLRGWLNPPGETIPKKPSGYILLINVLSPLQWSPAGAEIPETPGSSR
ncbi:hypothetical protein RRG08_023072 [Elysia crispata]|uniref:Uncharacterized protein n=1 Tax=Elysia crispata TaxID=231223 RepID=A0AAE1AS26_9GAST|nr:hypothetical protein RRG08_023072 [Elysia crispata]